MHDLALEDSGFQLYSFKDLNLIDNSDQTSLVNSFKEHPPLILPFDRDINSWGSGIDIGPHTSESLLAPARYVHVNRLSYLYDRQAVFSDKCYALKESYASDFVRERKLCLG